jgi:hypothetical protein
MVTSNSNTAAPVSSIAAPVSSLEVAQAVETLTVSQPVGTLVEGMQSTFMQKQLGETISLHDRTIFLPFYHRLWGTKDISPRELILHFANLAAICNKIETLIKTKKIFHDIFSEDIFRHEQVEKDILFFMTRFNLERPEITKETDNYLKFIDEIAKCDVPHLLLPIFYVQYSGLFLGRVVCNATENWLKERIKDWNDLPSKERGTAYWQFEAHSTSEQLKTRKEELLKKINQYGELLGEAHRSQLKIIARKAFEHNFNSIQSVTSLKVSSSIQHIVIRCLLIIALAVIIQKIITSKITSEK